MNTSKFVNQKMVNDLDGNGFTLLYLLPKKNKMANPRPIGRLELEFFFRLEKP